MNAAFGTRLRRWLGEPRCGRWAVALILAAACLALWRTAPVAGDFWWQDAPRHALNGAFLQDFLADLPWRDPAAWAVNYYVKYPALTILFYPPFFYVVEAAVYAVLGVSHPAAQFTVALFTFLLAVGSYRLARRLLPRWSALGVALLLIGAPEIAFWGRQVMLDIPAYATAVCSILYLVDYLRKGRPRDINLAMLFIVVSIYTKYNTVFLLPAMLLGVVAARGLAALRDRHAILAALVGTVAVLPAIYLMHRFGAVNMASVAGRAGDLPRTSLQAWLFYLEWIPDQLGYATAVLAAAGVVLLAIPSAAGKRLVQERWLLLLLLAWFAIGYVFFSWISVREPRHDLMILYPVVLVAALALHRLLGSGRAAQAALAGLGAATLGYSLLLDPPPTINGYREIADYVARQAPRNAVVLFSGYRDGNFIFDMRAHTERADLSFVRADKLLLRIAVERTRGVQQTDDDEAAIGRLLREDGIGMVVAQAGFWEDLRQMARFANVLHGDGFRQVAAFPISGMLSTNDGQGGASGQGAEMRVYVPTYPVARPNTDMVIEMPFIGDRFKGSAAE